MTHHAVKYCFFNLNFAMFLFRPQNRLFSYRYRYILINIFKYWFNIMGHFFTITNLTLTRLVLRIDRAGRSKIMRAVAGGQPYPHIRARMSDPNPYSLQSTVQIFWTISTSWIFLTVNIRDSKYSWQSIFSTVLIFTTFSSFSLSELCSNLTKHM